MDELLRYGAAELFADVKDGARGEQAADPAGAEQGAKAGPPGAAAAEASNPDGVPGADESALAAKDSAAAAAAAGALQPLTTVERETAEGRTGGGSSEYSVCEQQWAIALRHLGILECWHVGILAYWDIGILEFGILEYLHLDIFVSLHLDTVAC